MSYPRLAMRLYNVPLLILPDKAEVIEQVFRAYSEGEPERLKAFERPPRPELATNDSLQQTRGGYLRTADGIALIPVLGTLVQRGSGMDAMSGLTSYDQVGAQLSAALSDPLVRGILLEVDSPGGEGAGLFDLAGQIRAAAAQKPVIAHANEAAFSAGYAIASAAQELYVPRTGMVGSVGVIMLHADQSAYDAKRGIVYTPIFAGAHKADFNAHQPLSDGARMKAQDVVNRMYSVFVDHVASMRGMDPQAVRDTEAGLLHPDQAMSVGMADGVATMAEAMQTLRDRMNGKQQMPPQRMPPKRSSPAAGAAIPVKEMSMTQQAQSAPAAGTPAPAADDAAKLHASQLAEATTKAQADAKARIQTIQQCEAAKDRPKLAAHLAFATDMSAADAQALLAQAALETPAKPDNAFAAAMARTGNANVVPDAAASASTAAGDRNASTASIPTAANIYAFRQKCVADARR